MMLTAQLASVVRFLTDEEQFDPDKVTPGVGGFVVVAFLAIAVFLLGFDLVRRVRRAKNRAEIAESLAEEVAEMEAAKAAAAGANNASVSTDESADDAATKPAQDDSN